MFLAIAAVFFLAIHQGQCGMATTVILRAAMSDIVSGTLAFTQENADSPVQIIGIIFGLNASSAHGFHIHTDPVSESKPNCTAAGPHFNPYNVNHGSRSANITSRHVGDLGNITTHAEGEADVRIEDNIIQLYNATQSIVNRTVVIHLLRDDGGEGGFDDSNTTGNAGARIICGLIQLTEVDPTTTIETSVMTTEESSATTETTFPTSQMSTTTSVTTTITSETTTTTSVTTTITSETTTTTSVTTASSPSPSAGMHIQPVMFVLIITMIIDYILRY